MDIYQEAENINKKKVAWWTFNSLDSILLELNKESGVDKKLYNSIKPKTKKKKKQNSVDNKEVDFFEEFKEVFNKKTETINYEELRKFLLEVKVKDNPLEIAKKYTEAIQS